MLRVILEAHLDHRGADWTLSVNLGHDPYDVVRIVVSSRKLVSIGVVTVARPLSFSVRGPLGGVCIECSDLCFQRGKFYKLCFTFISARAVFSWENSFLLWQKWMWGIGENERPFLLQRKLPFAFAKKKKQNIWDKTTNISLFANPVKNVIFHQWRDYFPTPVFPFLKIMVSMGRVITHTYNTSRL